MYDISVNYWAVLVAALATMVLGYLWYSKPVFGGLWMKLGGMKDMGYKGNMGMMYLWMYIAAVVVAYVLAHFLNGATTIGAAWTPVFWIWLGFFVAGGAHNYMFPAKSFSLFALDMVYQLISLLLMAWILTMWM